MQIQLYRLLIMGKYLRIEKLSRDQTDILASSFEELTNYLSSYEEQVSNKIRNILKGM